MLPCVVCLPGWCVHGVYASLCVLGSPEAQRGAFQDPPGRYIPRVRERATRRVLSPFFGRKERDETRSIPFFGRNEENGAVLRAILWDTHQVPSPRYTPPSSTVPASLRVCTVRCHHHVDDGCATNAVLAGTSTRLGFSLRKEAFLPSE